jgi:hypothetical protein
VPSKVSRGALGGAAAHCAIIDDTGTPFYFDWQFESGAQYTSFKSPDAGSPLLDPWLTWEQGLTKTAQNDAGVTDFFVDTLPDGGVSGYKGLWNTSDDVAANVWVPGNFEVVDGCVSDGGC